MKNPNTVHLISQITEDGYSLLFGAMNTFFIEHGMIAFDGEACKQIVSKIYIYTISSSGDPVNWNFVRDWCCDLYIKLNLSVTK